MAALVLFAVGFAALVAVAFSQTLGPWIFDAPLFYLIVGVGTPFLAYYAYRAYRALERR